VTGLPFRACAGAGVMAFSESWRVICGVAATAARGTARPRPVGRAAAISGPGRKTRDPGHWQSNTSAT